MVVVGNSWLQTDFTSSDLGVSVAPLRLNLTTASSLNFRLGVAESCVIGLHSIRFSVSTRVVAVCSLVTMKETGAVDWIKSSSFLN